MYSAASRALLSANSIPTGSAVHRRQRMAQLVARIPVVADLPHALGEVGVVILRRQRQVGMTDEPADAAVRVAIVLPAEMREHLQVPDVARELLHRRHSLARRERCVDAGLQVR